MIRQTITIFKSLSNTIKGKNKIGSGEENTETRLIIEGIVVEFSSSALF